ncbi:MAG: hypothetical protein ABIY47_19910 [Opitutaceae bacterium]
MIRAKRFPDALRLLASASVLALTVTASAALHVAKQDVQLTVRVTGLPPGMTEVEFHIFSDRNASVSNSADTSVHDPAGGRRAERAAFWYPVVDLALEPDMTAHARFDDAVSGRYAMNGMFFPSTAPLASQLVIGRDRLINWENNLATDTPAALRAFYLVARVAVKEGEAQRTFALLSAEWSGRVSAHAPSRAHRPEDVLGEAIVLAEPPASSAGDPLENFRGTGLIRARLIASLEATIRFTQRLQDKSPNTPTAGGLNIFYDYAAKTHRRPSWIWAWGPSIKLLLDTASHVPEVTAKIPATELRDFARAIGEASRRFQLDQPGHPVDGVVTSRWRESEGTLARNGGFEQFYSVADALFLIGWGWVPLYRETGDKSYLAAALRLAAATRRLQGQFEIIPMDYAKSAEAWKNYTINEAGFGPEGLAAIYAATGDSALPAIGATYMDRLLKRFQQDNGLWARRFEFSPERTVPSQRMTRGEGWAMEGLIAAYDLTRDGKYRDLAVKMASHLVAAQHADGSWSYEFDQPSATVGISEKGTALWSLLFYRLHALTRDPAHLQAARRALTWCLENQSTGPDREGHGGIIGITFQSGVTYRAWFPLACSYTSAFFGLSVLEELKLQTAGAPLPQPVIPPCFSNQQMPRP